MVGSVIEYELFDAALLSVSRSKGSPSETAVPAPRNLYSEEAVFAEQQYE